MDEKERTIKERELGARFTFFSINLIEAHQAWFEDNEHRFNTFMKVLDHALKLSETDSALACLYLDKLLYDALNAASPLFTRQEATAFEEIRNEFYALSKS